MSMDKNHWHSYLELQAAASAVVQHECDAYVLQSTRAASRLMWVCLVQV